MSDIDPNHPSIRLRVLAKTLERLVRHMHPRLVYMDIAGMPTVVTTDAGEIDKVRGALETLAAELAERDRRDECPICEFGQPLPVEEKDGKKVSRWTCGHWIDHR